MGDRPGIEPERSELSVADTGSDILRESGFTLTAGKASTMEARPGIEPERSELSVADTGSDILRESDSIFVAEDALTMEARPGIEPGYAALQAAASPLCHLAGSAPGRPSGAGPDKEKPRPLGRGFGCLWSGKRDSNSRPQPWQGCALPLSYSRPSRADIVGEPVQVSRPETSRPAQDYRSMRKRGHAWRR